MKVAPIALVRELCKHAGVDPDNLARIVLDMNSVTFQVVTTIDGNPAIKEVEIPTCGCNANGSYGTLKKENA